MKNYILRPSLYLSGKIYRIFYRDTLRSTPYAQPSRSDHSRAQRHLRAKHYSRAQHRLSRASALIPYCLLLSAYCVLSFAQVSFTEHIIDPDYERAFAVFAIDLDDDNDVDILGTKGLQGKFTWWENDGYQNFTPHLIDSGFTSGSSVYAIDVEPDGDIDILGTYKFPGLEAVGWWENDGNQNFTRHDIATNFVNPFSAFGIDINDDNDVDVLAVAFDDEEITWWENDGDENFIEHTLRGDYDGAYSVYACDIDDDLDIDILGAAYDINEITWWENDGDENFSEHLVGYTAGAVDVYAIDVEPDGDVDIIGAGYLGNIVLWWENDGNENWTMDTIATDFTGAWSVFAIDLDQDMDIDILGVATLDSTLAWWENDGNENFTMYYIDDSLDDAIAVYAIDIDDDTDIDVLSAARQANEITWWENDLIGIEENISTPIQNHEFCATILTGPLQLPADKSCKVFDITGRTVNANHLAPGIYFIEANGVITQKVIKIK